MCVLSKTFSAYINIYRFEEQKQLPTAPHCVLNLLQCKVPRELLLVDLALPDSSNDRLCVLQMGPAGDGCWWSAGWCQKVGSKGPALGCCLSPCQLWDAVPEAAWPNQWGVCLLLGTTVAGLLPQKQRKSATQHTACECEGLVCHLKAPGEGNENLGQVLSTSEGRLQPAGKNCPAR